MTETEVKVLVEGGKATAAPPLGPALGPLGVNIAKVVEEINKKTSHFKGMEVPVRVVVNVKTKEFKVIVGKPPVSALIKKELGLEGGSKKPGEVRVGDLTMEQVKKIARMKFDSDEERYINQVIGTARSMGISVGKGELTEEEKKKIREMEAEKAQAAAKAEETA